MTQYAGSLGSQAAGPGPRFDQKSSQQKRRQLGDLRGDAVHHVTNSAGTLLIPVPISPREMDGIEPIVRRVAARLGGLQLQEAC